MSVMKKKQLLDARYTAVLLSIAVNVLWALKQCLILYMTDFYMFNQILFARIVVTLELELTTWDQKCNTGNLMLLGYSVALASMIYLDVLSTWSMVRGELYVQWKSGCQKLTTKLWSNISLKKQGFTYYFSSIL